MDSKELYRVFERQRRNLILMSVLLFGIIVTGVTIKEINFVLVKMNVPNHDHILLFLWVIFCYFIIRYNHYLKAVGLTKLNEEVKRIFHNMIAKEIVNNSTELKLENFDRTNFKDIYDRFERVNNAPRTDNINKNIAKFTINMSIIGHKDDGQTAAITEKLINEVIDFRKHKAKKFYSWMKVAINNYNYIEFYFPNIMALIVIILAIPELQKMLH